MRRQGLRWGLLALLVLGGLLSLRGAAHAAAASWRLQTHPDGGLFVGDVVSFEVLPPVDWRPAAGDARPQVTLQVQPPDGPQWQAPVQPHGIAARRSAVFAWVWGTHDLRPGAYPVEVRYRGQVVLRQTVTLAPAAQRPWWEEGVAWAEAAWPAATTVYMTRTPAARDLALVRHALTAIRQDLARLEGFPQTDDPVPLVLMPRLLGQGGFASQYLWVTFRDRDATGSAFPVVARHEMVHWLDRQRSAEYRSLMLVEGLAVYLTGGHYKPEPLAPRAAALLRLGRFIPITQLAAGYFYDYQHEIAYLEAGALVEYLVERWGWDAFAALYWGLDPDAGDGPAAILDAGLRRTLGVDLATLAADFEAYLRTQPDAAAWADDVALTVATFDTLRRYQQQMDPSAYYGTAWLPNLARLRELGVVADAVRGPADIAHVTVELLLQDAQMALRAGAYADARRDLDAVNALLDAAARGESEPWRAHPEAARVAAWVRAARACDLEPTDLERRGPGEVWVWGWPRDRHPTLAAMRIAIEEGPGGAPDAFTVAACRVALHRGRVWTAAVVPLYLPGPPHYPRGVGR